MKKITLILLTTFLFGCCNKDDNEAINPIDQLPEATQIGANTAGCLVDEEAFLPSYSLRLDYNNHNFALSLSNRINNEFKVILISLDNIEIQINEPYIINPEFSNDARSGEYVINLVSPPSPFYYTTTETITGELTITHHDFGNAFLSGTFWFDAVNSNGEIVEIREGRFDAEY